MSLIFFSSIVHGAFKTTMLLFKFFGMDGKGSGANTTDKTFVASFKMHLISIPRNVSSTKKLIKGL